MLRRGAPVFRPASTREAGRNSHRYPSAWRSRQQGWRNATHARQERRSSDRHGGHRPRNSHRYPSAWRSRQRGWRNATHATNTRSAGLQTGIAATGRETPTAIRLHGAAGNKDGATPTTPGTPGAPVFRPASRPQAAKLPPLSVRMAQQATRMAQRHRGWRNANHARNTTPQTPGAPVFRPASRPQAAKLPPLSVCMAHGHGNAALRAVLPVGPGTARRRRAAGKDPREGPPVRRWSPSRREPRREASPG